MWTLKFDVYKSGEKLYNELEIEMDIFKMRCSEFDAANLSDYRRGAFGISQYFGVELKSVDTKCKFALVVHQHKKSLGSVMVEIFKYILPENAKKPTLVPIPPETLKKLTNNIFHNMIVEFKGHGFIKGMKYADCVTLRPSYDLCCGTNAYDFIKNYGNALATALAYPDDVHDLDEGAEFNMKIYDIQNFVHEMDETGLYTCGIKNATARIKGIQEDMVAEDKTIREHFATWHSALDTLAHYGIEYKREKDSVWP